MVPATATAPEGVAAVEENIADALQTASEQGLTQVWVPTGTHVETVELIAGVSIYGGFDAAAGWARTRTQATTVVGTGPVLTATGVSSETTVALISFEAEDAAPEADSVAAKLVESTGVILEEVALRSGQGGAGIDAVMPEATEAGGPGGSGGPTGAADSCESGLTPAPRASGGAGGLPVCGSPVGGLGGRTTGSDYDRGTPNPGGSGCTDDRITLCYNASSNENGGDAPSGNGRPGLRGEPGEPGEGAGMGVFEASGYVRPVATMGTDGETGQGGGGGGAGCGAGCFRSVYTTPLS